MAVCRDVVIDVVTEVSYKIEYQLQQGSSIPGDL